MNHTNTTPNSGNPYCLNPATGKWELPTHYLAYETETTSWSAPIAARHAAELPADTILTPILTGREYGEQTTAGALAAWLSRKPEIQEKPTKKGLMDILNTPIGEILSNPRPHPISELINGPKPEPTAAQQAESAIGGKPYIPGDTTSDHPSPEARYHYLVIEHMKVKGFSGNTYDTAGLQAKLNEAASRGYRLVGVCSPTFGAGAQLASMFTGGSSMHLQGVVAVMEKECNQSREESK